MPTCRRIKLDPYVSVALHKTQLRKEQRPKSLKELEVSIGSTLYGTGIGKKFGFRLIVSCLSPRGI